MPITKQFERQHHARWILMLAAALLIGPPTAAADGRAAGLIAAWGVNQFGQVGPAFGPDGTKVPSWLSESAEPDVTPTATAIAAGAYHNLAVAANGTVWAWGANYAGQLGDGTTVDRKRPIRVSSLTHVIAVAGGQSHSLALRSDGSVWAWGDNQRGQLGDGGTENSGTPVKVKGLELTRDVRERVIAIAAGAWFSLALQSDGTIWAWGSNQFGQLGDGSFDDRLEPVRVTSRKGEPLDRVKAIEAGYDFSLALRANGTVWAWGSNSAGQLGRGSIGGASPNPGRVSDRSGPGAWLRNVIAIAGGGSHSLALIADGTVRAWGMNERGQLGNDTTIDSAFPVVVRWGPNNLGGLGQITAIAAGGFHSLALRSDGTARAWGDNFYGQLGDGTDIPRLVPVEILSTGFLDVRAIAAGRDHSLDLHGDIVNTFKWGNHLDGLPGDPAPVQVTHVPNTAPIDADVDGGYAHSLLLTTAGHVFAWGENDSGQLGDGTHDPHSTPLSVRQPNGVGQLEDVKSIAAGIRHNLALTAGGAVYAWGKNDMSQLGDGTTDPHPLPVLVKDPPGASNGKLPPRRLAGVIAVAAGSGHSLALSADGTVWAWGSNDAGQLGDGSTTDRSLPVRVKGPRGRHRGGITAAYLTGIVAIAAGGRFSLALRVDGSVWAWGANDEGQLGDGTFIDRRYPTAVVADGQSAFPYLTGVKGIGAGMQHTLAIGSAGTLRSWGSAVALGRGANTNQPTPGTVDGAGTEPALSHVEAVAAGVGHSLALRSDGTAWGWGLNGAGQVGDGTFADRDTPVQVMWSQTLPFTHPTVIGAGFVHSLAINWSVATVVPVPREQR